MNFTELLNSIKAWFNPQVPLHLWVRESPSLSEWKYFKGISDIEEKEQQQ
jgi:hypothetical protein